MYVTIVLVLLSFCQNALSQVSSQERELSREELSLQEKASRRLYPGGPDEEDLQVMEGVTSATADLNGLQIENEVYEGLYSEENDRPLNNEPGE